MIITSIFRSLVFPFKLIATYTAYTSGKYGLYNICRGLLSYEGSISDPDVMPSRSLTPASELEYSDSSLGFGGGNPSSESVDVEDVEVLEKEASFCLDSVDVEEIDGTGGGGVRGGGGFS